MIASERGFTLVEILISLALFAVVVVGALGVLGAAGSGGFLESFPSGFAAMRVARDMTAASVYLQAFQEYSSGVGGAALNQGTYCLANSGSNCGPTPALAGAGLGSFPPVPGYPYQLNWQTLYVTIDWWYWDNTATKYCIVGSPGCAATSTTEHLVRIDSKLKWQYRGFSRTLEVSRFLP